MALFGQQHVGRLGAIDPWAWALLAAAGLVAWAWTRPAHAGIWTPPTIWDDCRFGDAAPLRDADAVAHGVQKYGRIAENAAEEFGVPADRVLGTIYVESRFKPRAVSSAGARGLMQLMPGTSKELARKLGIADDPFDPEANIRMGTSYLARLFSKYGDWDLAHAAYFAGPGNVDSKLAEGLPPLWSSYAAGVDVAAAAFATARRVCAQQMGIA